MRHSRVEQKRRWQLFAKFLKANPPKMPAEFSHREFKRVVSYAKTAFITGYNTGENDAMRGRI